MQATGGITYTGGFTVTPPPAGPAAPTGLVATRGNGQLSIAFTPGSAGDSTIINYQYSLDGTNYTAFSPAVTTSPVVITGLSNGTTYTVYLKAESYVGVSPASASATGTPATTPAAVTGLSATRGNTQLSIAFTPGSDGGNAITNYKYSLDGTNYTAFSPAVTTSPVVVTGLTNGTAYTVYLKAVNSVGDGTASAGVSGTPATTPAAPTGLSTIAGDTTLTVAFTPGSTGGNAITNYKYSLDGTNYTASSPAVTASPVIITGLTNGTTYTVSLKAVNSVGDGAASANVSGTPAPLFSAFGGAYNTNAPQTDSTYGDTTSINSDGTVFVTGAPNINKVYVYSRSGTTWSLQQTITGTGYFGLNLAVSSDGLTLFVGNQSGNGKIYTRANTGTTFSSVFNTSATRVDLVALSYDGTTFVYPDTGTSLKLGKNTAGTWSEIATYSLTSSSNNFPPLTMNSDGSRLAYAKVYETVSSNLNAGQVKILSWGRTATSPTLVQTINDPNPAAQNLFGHNLTMSPDGNTLVMSSKYNGNSLKGAVYVYRWDGSQYNLEQSFIGAANNDKLGQSNALGGDVLILTKATTPHQYLAYTRSGSTWSLQQTTSLPTGFTSQSADGINNGYLNRTALSTDGKQFIVVEPTGTSRFVYNYQGG